MDTTQIVGWISDSIYFQMAIVALYGIYTVILLARRITQKRFSSHATAVAFLDEVREHLDAQRYDAVAELCDSPPWWSKAVPQLILVGLANRNLPASKLRKLMDENFEREILADIQYRMSWIGVCTKTEPMLGLLGTVTGMIAAFGKIATAQKAGADPSALAGDISFALFTTAIGLMTAIPFTVLAAWLQVRIGKLQDEVQQYMGVFLEDLENAAQKVGRR